MFEHATLQEAYTGSLIAGKGKSLNNIKVIMERTRFKTEDWARVRFGAGTPWRRCWCVITPPDEKEVQKRQKSLKKKSAYERPGPILKGTVRFYDTKKTKKTLPIATINDAYSAYAIYPQSKPLIDQSTLVKVEGIITIHSTPETTTEGFLFVMPEVHPAVSGFEMMLRWLFPLYDVFGLYGRPNRLIADTLDTRSLMFALPQERRYGYLEILDVAGLIHEPGSQTWKERDWRKKLKELTSSRVSAMRSDSGRSRSRASSYRGHRNSLPSRTGTLRYEDAASIRSSPSIHNGYAPSPPPHVSGSAPPPSEGPFRPPPASRTNSHQRSVSEVLPYTTPRYQKSQRSVHEAQQIYTPSRLSHEASRPNETPSPAPPAHGVLIGAGMRNRQVSKYSALDNAHDRSSSESERRLRNGVDIEAQEVKQDVRPSSPPAPVAAPPAFAHEPGVKPQRRPQATPQMIRASSRLSITTLSQLADAGRLASSDNVATAGASAAWRNRSNTVQANGTSFEPQSQREIAEESQGIGDYRDDQGPGGVNAGSSNDWESADQYPTSKGMVLNAAGQPAAAYRQRADTSYPSSSDGSPLRGGDIGQPRQARYGLDAPPTNNSRSASPLSKSSVQSVSPSQHSQAEATAVRNFSRHGTTPPPTSFPDKQRPEMNRTNTSHSIIRKPVPVRDRSQSLVSETPGPASKSSLDSLRRRFVDEDALNQIIAQQDSRTNTMDSQAQQFNDVGSIYDDESTASPDYASTRKSTDTRRSKRSIEKPRVGVLKTVGTVEPETKDVVVGDTFYKPDVPSQQVNPDIPLVDFGPTQAFDPRSSSRPNTSGTMTQLGPETSKSSDRFNSIPRVGSPSPTASQGNGLLNLTGRPNEPIERAPSRNLTTPELDRRTPSAGSDQEHRRSIAWQPGAIVGGGSPGSRQPITPEQFVQQRATTSRATPVYAHGPKPSGSTPPPASRFVSGEVPSHQHVRKASYARDLQTSPHGRVASNGPIQGDYSANLSAREQEHVARATGSPLINMAGNSGKQAAQGGGLIGAIEAREQERKDIRQGWTNNAVQHAIAQRQQYSQSQQNKPQSSNAPTPQMNMPGQWPQTPSIYAQTPGQYPPSPGYAPTQYGYGMQQQQQPQMYDQPQLSPQPRQQQWPTQGGQFISNQQVASPYQQQYQQYQQYPQHYQQTAFQQQQAMRQQQAPYQQNQAQQQQYYGPYFGTSRLDNR